MEIIDDLCSYGALQSNGIKVIPPSVFVGIPVFDVTEIAIEVINGRTVPPPGLMMSVPFPICLIAFRLKDNGFDSDMFLTMEEHHRGSQTYDLIVLNRENIRSVLLFDIFQRRHGYRKQLPLRLPVRFAILMNNDRTIAEDGELLVFDKFDKEETDGEMDDNNKKWKPFIEFVDLLVIKFQMLLSCKNIKTERVECSPKLEKRYKERHGHARPKYYVLTIDPLKTRTITGGRIYGNKNQALHVCRGHFKHYDEKPLFGKVKGTFWIPAHARGNRENGVIVKDYKIENNGKGSV